MTLCVLRLIKLYYTLLTKVFHRALWIYRRMSKPLLIRPSFSPSAHVRAITVRSHMIFPRPPCCLCEAVKSSVLFNLWWQCNEVITNRSALKEGESRGTINAPRTSGAPCQLQVSWVIDLRCENVTPRGSVGISGRPCSRWQTTDNEWMRQMSQVKKREGQKCVNLPLPGCWRSDFRPTCISGGRGRTAVFKYYYM